MAVMGLLGKLIPQNVKHAIVTRTFLRPTRQAVLKGPFAGLKYVSASTGGSYYCKLLGTYEQELNPCVEAIRQAAPKRIVDIGAAEGYYAVGLAKILPKTQVIAFEMTEIGRSLLARMANLSPYHFLRIFECLTGVTPHQFILRARLRAAATRLVEEPHKILDIALDCGFGDVSNFNRAFRTEFGMSPRRYRQQEWRQN